MYVLVYFVSLTYNRYVHTYNKCKVDCMVVYQVYLLHSGPACVVRSADSQNLHKLHNAEICMRVVQTLHAHTYTCTVFPFYKWALTVWQMFTVYSLLMSVYRMRGNFREFHKSTGIHENENVKICT